MTHPLLQPLSAKLTDIDAQGLRRKRLSAETPCQPHLVVDGKPMLAFNSNDYLGLAAHPQVVEALKEGASDVEALVVKAQKALDKAAKTNVIHKNKASRLKSQVAKKAKAVKK